MTIKTTCFHNFTWCFRIMGHRGQYYLRSHTVTGLHWLQYNLEVWAGQSPRFCVLWQMRKWVKAGKCGPSGGSADASLCGSAATPSPLTMYKTGIMPDSVQPCHERPVSPCPVSAAFHEPRIYPLSLHLCCPSLTCWRFPFPSSQTSQSPARSSQAPHLTDELQKTELTLQLKTQQLPWTIGSTTRDIWEETLSGSQKGDRTPQVLMNYSHNSYRRGGPSALWRVFM